MSYALGLGKGRPRTGALLAISGFIPTVDGWEPDLESPFPPIAIAHGTYDPVIPVEFARGARDARGGRRRRALSRVADRALDRPAGDRVPVRRLVPPLNRNRLQPSVRRRRIP